MKGIEGPQVPQLNTKENRIDRTKEFSLWTKEYLLDLYNGASITEVFNDPVEERLDEYFPEQDRLITVEKADLVKIFLEELIQFSNKMIFENEFSEEKKSIFFKKLHDQFFGKSPDMFMFLNGNYSHKILMISKVNETYGLSTIPDNTGEITYDLAFVENEEFLEKLTNNILKFSVSEKISVIKQLSQSARRAIEGYSGFSAYEKIRIIINGIKDKVNQPLISSFCEFELAKIDEYADQENDDFFMSDEEEYELYNSSIDSNKDLKEIEYEVIGESDEFFSVNSIIPELPNVFYTQVSKDYGSIISQHNFIPFALVKKDKLETKETKKLFSAQKITEIKKIIEELDSKNNKLSVQNKRDFDDFLSVLKSIVKEDNEQRKKIPIKNYDGLTQQKDFNPLGNDDFSHLVKLFHSPEIRFFINKRLNIQIENLNLREQIHLLRFLSESDEKRFQKIENILVKNKNNESFLRSFLSLSGRTEMGEKILTLGEKLPQESADVLFATYSQIIDATEEVGKLLEENLKDKATPEIIQQAKESLLIAGKDLLEKYADKASVCEDIECDTLGKELEERLALAKTSVFAFSYVCKTLVENGEFSFEDFKKAKLSYDKSPISEKMKQDIIAMHEVNTQQYPEKLRDTWRGTLREGLEKENEDQLVVFVSYEDDVVSAMRVLKQADGSWYGASFNVNPTIQGSRIGTELLKKVLQGLAKDKPFVADCYSGNPMLDTYINKFGFQITKEIPNYENTGELVYQITLFPQKEVEQPDPNIHQK